MSPTRREILRSAECSYCGYMVPAEDVTIPPEMDVSKFRKFRDLVRCHPGTCEPKGGQTVSFINGRLQYTPLPAEWLIAADYFADSRVGDALTAMRSGREDRDEDQDQ